MPPATFPFLITMVTTFLPIDTVEEIAKEAASNGRFLSPSKLTGEKRVRFVGEGITGHSGWTTDRKPVRFEAMPETLPADLAPDMAGRVGLKRFIAGVVWDYEANEFKILEITQKTLMDLLFKYVKDSDYGDPTNYDIKISKTGEGKNTEYSLIAAPPKPLTKEITKAYEEANINLRALFDGEDPFADPTA